VSDIQHCSEKSYQHFKTRKLFMQPSNGTQKDAVYKNLPQV